MFNKPGQAPHKKDPSLKSQPFRFRLHPEIPQEKWAIDAIAWYETEQGMGLRELVVKALLALAEIPTPPPLDNVYAVELARVGDLLDMVVELVQSGAAASSQAPVTRARGGKSEKLALPRQAINVLQKLLDEGVVAEEEDEYSESMTS